MSAVLGFPLQLLAVSQNTRSKGRTVVATEANEHDTHLRHFLAGDDAFLLEDGRGDSLRLVIEGKAIYVLNFDILSRVHSLNAWGSAGGILGEVEVFFL